MTEMLTEAAPDLDTVEGLLAAYPLGTRWRVNTRRPYSATLDEGDTVERVTAYTTIPNGVSIRDAERRLYVSPIGEDDRPVPDHIFYVGPQHLDSLSTVESATLSVDVISREDHEQVVADIRRDLAARDARVQTLERQVSLYVSDVEILNQEFLEAADENDLCSVFDQTVDNVNRRTSLITLEGRSRDFTAERRVQVTVWVTQTGNYSGRSSDEPGESDIAWTDIDTDDVLDAVRSDWDADYYNTDGFDVEESD